MPPASSAGRAWRAVLAAVALYGFALQVFAAGLPGPVGDVPGGVALCAHGGRPEGPPAGPGTHGCCTAACVPALPMPSGAHAVSVRPDLTATLVRWQPAIETRRSVGRWRSPQARGPPVTV